VEFGLECGIAARLLISTFEIEHERHQGFGNETSAIGTEMTLIIRACAEGIGCCHAAAPAKCAVRADAMKDWIISWLFTPGDVSTPDDTSTPGALDAAIARATFSDVRPPARSQGREIVRERSNCQSNATPCPPARSAYAGGLASNSSISAASS